MTEIIEQIRKEAASLRETHTTVGPGCPGVLSEAACIGDFFRQGDIYITVAADQPPADYQLVENPGPEHLQLAIGDTRGARHCLDSLEGVELHLPKEFGKDETDLRGPYMRMSQERSVPHPEHGAVTIAKGLCVVIGYQKDQDLEDRVRRQND